MISALTVPDARLQPVPLGWWETTAAPTIQSLETWDELDEAEAHLLAMASIIESMNGDVIEYEKALRVVEMRRGELADPDAVSGRHLLNTHVKELPDDVSPMTVSRWREMARGAEEIRELLRSARHRSEISQAACLRVVRGEEKQEDQPIRQRITLTEARRYIRSAQLSLAMLEPNGVVSGAIPVMREFAESLTEWAKKWTASDSSEP